jgi:hypothetical protein
MSRKERALAAGDLITVRDKEYRLRPVGAQHLADLERDALRAYKRQYLQTFADAAEDLEMNGKGDEMLSKKTEEVARWTLRDLPQIVAYDVSSIPVTDALKAWAVEKMPDIELDNNLQILALLSDKLDNKEITAAEVDAMCGKRPIVGKVRYDQWWVTATFEGRIGFITSSVRAEHSEVTKKDVGGWPLTKLIEGARIVEHITSADIKNMSGPQP